MMGGGMMGGNGLGAFGLVGGILNLVITLGLIAGFVLLIVWLVRSVVPSLLDRRQEDSGRDSSAREILDNRFARGELSREQYQAMKQELANSA